MAIRLLVHLEPSGDQQVWWAESPDVPGFSASDATLKDLLARSTWALAEITEERGEDPASMDLVYQLVGTVGSDNPTVAEVEPAPEAQRSDTDVRIAIAG